LGVLLIERERDLPGQGFDQRDNDGTVVKRAGQCSDPGQGSRCISTEGADGIAFTTISTGATLMAGIEESARNSSDWEM
jgi:hypothetical protein